MVILASLPFVGLTQSERDTKEGLVLDFGYWNTEWDPIEFGDGWNGKTVLEKVCEQKGYESVWLPDGSLYAVNTPDREDPADREHVNLVGMTWRFYVHDGSGWLEILDPEGTDISGYTMVSWARSAGADSLIPCTDYTGFSYYSYADNGKNRITGQDLKVVTLAPSVTETVAAVGGLPYIIGCDYYSNYPQGIVDGKNNGTIANTGGYVDPNYEWIIKLHPDIVFCDGDVGQDVAVADKLRKSGVDCVVLYRSTDIASMYNNIWICASALGMSEKANTVISSLKKTIDDVSGIAGATNKRVFVALSADPSPWTAGNSTFMSDIVSTAGGRNIFDSQSSGWFMVSKEQIYAKQPQVLIIFSEKEIKTEEEYNAILDSLDPVWKSTPAYKAEEKEVYVFSANSADILSRPGPRLAEATELICKILNQEAFLQRDPMDAIPHFFGNDYTDYLTYQGEPLYE